MVEHDLICMRLADMERVHPKQITGVCSKCTELVGIYPSGQQSLADHKGNINIVCHVCWQKKPSADICMLAPGAENEPAQSVPRRKQ